MKPSLVNYKDLIPVEKLKIKKLKIDNVPHQFNKFENTNGFFINILALLIISIGFYYLYKRKSDKSKKEKKHIENIEKLRKISENI